ncbi:hypothetical protein GCM10010286_15010 [Streptomyces toxytricini]|nr:hypothetical protein GCM10010286_15010 [Streptomyces toxytricini]
MRAERGGHAGVGMAGGRLREIAFDVVAPAEEQGDEHGRAGGALQRVGEEGPVQLDVAEADVEAGAQGADTGEEGLHGGEGARVAAAVGDGDEGGLHAWLRGAGPAAGAGERAGGDPEGCTGSAGSVVPPILGGAGCGDVAPP